MRLDYSAGSFAAWDRFGRVVDQLWADYGTTWTDYLSYYPGAGADPDHFSYVYDRAGNVTGRANSLNANFNETYAYDALSRLTDADRANSFDQSWGLDGQGNFASFDDDGTPQTRATDAANQITGITGGWIGPQYDAAGNMISGPQTGNESVKVHYIYDAWNRLVAVKADSGGSPGAVIATFVYDGLNRRVEKFDQYGWGHHCYYDLDWRVLDDREVDNYGALQAVNDYVWSLRGGDSPMACLRDGNVDGDVTDTYPDDWTRYYLTDANNNVTTTIRYDNYYGYIPLMGETVGRNVYAAYGKLTDRLNASWGGSNVEAAFDGPLYCGYWFDTETGLYQVRNRYYDTGLSTWINRDPIGYEGGTSNLYVYCGCNPTNRTDPTGLSPQSDYDQQLLDYYQRVLQQTMLVADALWANGPSYLSEKMPWYTITNAGNDNRGASGSLYVTVGKTKTYFPKDWPDLQRPIANTMRQYTKIAWDRVDITWGDQSSHNFGWFPGIALNRRNFYGTEFSALQELIHEPMHNMGSGFLWLGLGHGHIDPIVGVGNSNSTYARLLTFLQTARVASEKSLWGAMLEEAGPRPKKPDDGK